MHRTLDVSAAQHESQPVYADVLLRMRGHGEKLLDLGCGLGQDIRKLIHDGAPAANVYGCDAMRGLADAGYDLFQDRSRLPNAILIADIFATEPPTLAGPEGEVDMVFAGSIFHLFDWQQQAAIAERIVKHLQTRTGSLVFGHHLGHLHAGNYPYGLDSSSTIFKHDEQSFQRLWQQVGEATETSWKVEATLEIMAPAGFNKDGKWGDPDGRLMRFAAERM